MNIYKVNDCDWVAAESFDSAAEFYRRETGTEIDRDEAYELDGEELDTLIFVAEEGCYGLAAGEYTFRTTLAGAVAGGYTEPFLFASTEI